MSEYNYNPKDEADLLGLKIKYLSFKRLNSFLIEKVIYLRKSMNHIEKRCALTYEIVHYLWNNCNGNEKKLWHSKNVEEILKQQTARKLVCPDRLKKLLETRSDIDEISRELEVTNEILFYYLKYCKSKVLYETSLSTVNTR